MGEHVLSIHEAMNSIYRRKGGSLKEEQREGGERNQKAEAGSLQQVQGQAGLVASTRPARATQQDIISK